MTYVPIEDFRKLLYDAAPTKVDWLTKHTKRTVHGLLPVGLKLHCIKSVQEIGVGFASFIASLGEEGVPELNHYKRTVDCFCFVLPPVGSADAAITLVECIEVATGVAIFNNPAFQIQICSPGRLDSERAGVLTMGAILGSDTIPKLAPSRFSTTFSRSAAIPRGVRLTIYDGLGKLERDFEWWALRSAEARPLPWLSKQWKESSLQVQRMLPFKTERTDILTGTSRIDIRVANLISTLLVHDMYGWYWGKLGHEFITSMRRLLAEHHLTFQRIPWICSNEKKGDDAQEERDNDDSLYWDLLLETYEYLDHEAARIRKGGRGGILFDARALIDTTRFRLVEQAQSEIKREGRR